jgi:hypothetical protein
MECVLHVQPRSPKTHENNLRHLLWRISFVCGSTQLHLAHDPVDSAQEEVGHEEGAMGGVVLPRTAFLHTADQLHCPLFLPWPGDQVGPPQPHNEFLGSATLLTNLVCRSTTSQFAAVMC